jgi:glucuronokinase
MTPESASGQAPARAALAGNPSDGYGGAVLAVTLPDYSARAQVRSSGALAVNPDSELVRATVGRFARDLVPAAADTAVRWSTTIPRGVGLGGSSAIVIAVLRALCSLHGVALPRAQLAELALAVEVEELGIAGGLQDRVTQAYADADADTSGRPRPRVVFMDFAPGSGGYETLDASLLPPLLIAWRSDTAAESGAVHAPLRDRYEHGEPAVRDGLRDLASLARHARDALDRGFDQRRRMLALDPRHVEMVACARTAGASVNYAGSGGAIVAVCQDDGHRHRVAAALGQLGCQTAATAPA